MKTVLVKKNQEVRSLIVLRMRALPSRAAPAALGAALVFAATRVAQRAAVAASPRTTFPVRAFSRRRQGDNDNLANQFKRNKDKNKNSRDMDNPAAEEHDNDNANEPSQDDNHDYDYDEYWHSTRRGCARSERFTSLHLNRVLRGFSFQRPGVWIFTNPPVVPLRGTLASASRRKSESKGERERGGGQRQTDRQRK